VIIVAPAPIFGLEIIENTQDLVARLVGSYKYDLEHWHANPDSLLDLMAVVLKLEPSPCIILSGDVHYAFEGIGEVQGGGLTMRVGQFTSSAMKNAAPGVVDALVMGALGFTQTLAQALDIFSLVTHRTLYWRVGRGVNHILDTSNPVDLAIEAIVRALHGRGPDLRESIDFQPLGLSQAFNTVLGANNVGELRVHNNDVVHRLHYARSGGGTGTTPEHRF
jgi:hypothetical protein